MPHQQNSFFIKKSFKILLWKEITAKGILHIRGKDFKNISFQVSNVYYNENKFTESFKSAT